MTPEEQDFFSRVESYLPDWQYDPGDGQPEGAVLYAAWRLLEDTRQRMERLPEKHEAEFLRAWGLEPAEPTPRSAYAALAAPEGALVPAGSELYLSGDGTRLWKTAQAVHAESLTLTGQVLESGRRGKLLMLPPPTRESPTRLFDFRSPGHQRRAARFACPDVFRSQSGCTADLDFPDAEEALAALLSDGSRVRWTLETEDGSQLDLSPPRRSGTKLRFTLPPAPGAAALTADLLPGAAASAASCKQVLAASHRESLPCPAAVCDDGTVTEGVFQPFGSRLEPWRCCYLSCPDVLALRGGRVTFSFTLSFLTREESLPGADQAPVYRPVMRRLPTPPPEPQDVFVENTAWEYWNGSAWLPLPGSGAWSGIFADAGEARPVQVHLSWPPDARPCAVRGQPGCWLRWRVTRTEGGGALPRRLHVPEVGGLRMSGTLEGRPAGLSVCSGLDPRFHQRQPEDAGPLFPPLGPEEEGWWLRFDHAPHGDTLSLFVSLSGRTAGSRLSAWEAGPKGLRPLGLQDGTEGLLHSGCLELSGILGAKTQQFGQGGWWVCLRDREGRLSQGRRFPQLTGLVPGAVCLRAQDTCLAGEPVLPRRGGAVSGMTLTDSFGGAPGEDARQTLSRARQRRHHLGRGVSPLDVEQLVREHFRDVVRTRSRREGHQVLVAVLMRDVRQHSAAFAQRRDGIIRLLEENTAIPTLGLQAVALEPNFYPIQVMAWLRPGPEGDFQGDSQAVRLALERFLHPVTGKFRGDGWRIGEMPEEVEVRNYLRHQLPQVRLVKLLLTAVTPQGREVDCKEVRDPFALPIACDPIIREVSKEGL